MDPMTIIIAAIAAVGVLLVFLSLANGPDVNARLERYAAAAPVDTKGKKDNGAALRHRCRVCQPQPRRRTPRLGQQPRARARSCRPDPQAE